MYRSHTCGELRASHIEQSVTLSGWISKVRDKGFVVWIDLRDRYGITQLVFDEERTDKTLLEQITEIENATRKPVLRNAKSKCEAPAKIRKRN